MTKAEKIVRDILNDRCKGFKVGHPGNTNYFNFSFEIPYESMVYIDLKMMKKIVDVLTVESLHVSQLNRGFRVDVTRVPSVFMLDVATVDGVRAKQDTSIGPVRCKTCNEPPFRTLALALEHVELVHRGDVELDKTFNEQAIKT